MSRRFEAVGKLRDLLLDCCCWAIYNDEGQYCNIGHLANYIDAHEGDIVRVVIEVVQGDGQSEKN